MEHLLLCGALINRILSRVKNVAVKVSFGSQGPFLRDKLALTAFIESMLCTISFLSFWEGRNVVSLVGTKNVALAYTLDLSPMRNILQGEAESC